ncbi:MAG TPA: TAXI family TRAP transporter solute-binding subunit [Burkholderiales bacterium]|nr:TAXI family TRAP transporter solute-binding subunit [Burkholderiales bacterium]
MSHVKKAIACVLAAAAFAVAAAPALAQDRSGWPQRLTLGTGPVGGFGHTTGSPWASTVGAAVGVPISVESTGGFPINMLMVNDRKADIGYSTSDVAFQGWQGDDWSKGKPVRRVRMLMVLDANVLQIYALRSAGIASISDLNGKSVNPSRRRSATDLVLRDAIEAIGIKPSRITNVSPADANNLLGDGRLDAAAVMGSIPHPAVTEFEVNHDTVLISFSAADLKKYLAKAPFMRAFTIPAGTFKSQKQPVQTVASYIVVLARDDLPESLAYELVKATFARKETLAAAHKSFGRIDPKSILNATIPVHPGAIRYYEEQGIRIPQNLQTAN